MTVRLQVARLDGGDHEQQPRESHADLAKASLAKEEGVKLRLRDFVADHHGQPGSADTMGSAGGLSYSIFRSVAVYILFLDSFLPNRAQPPDIGSFSHLSSLQVS